ncbi:hypothetical protein ACFQAV_09995 [Companilactobacillus huachuanensis]|uniref:Surface layer protein A domain-containing protein n=1 Tax=Companilactobacillus huachuanensis TaxID=2559914 RepID=A0ABW1RM38_9LACO|nr:hypothetical protein [Companilactobacillus huachuanensis]
MKKGIISSIIASGLILIGSIFPAIAQASTTTTSNIDMNATGVVTTNKMAYLNGLHGNVFLNITDRGLAPNTAWYYNQTVIGADGLKYYRVATNEWVASNYLGKVTVKNATVTTPVKTPNVNTSNGKIVGNSDSKIYHLPGQQNYKINVKNVVYFNTEQDAINAGYQKSKK